MKRTFTLFAALLLTIAMNAAYSQSTISISSAGKSAIRVTIDDNRFNVVDNALTVDDLRPGSHSIKIYRQRRGIKSNRFNNNFELVYNARINIKPQYDVDIIINRFGRAFFDEQRIGASYHYEEDHNNWPDDNSNEYNTHRSMKAESFGRFKESLKNESFDETRMNIAKQVISANWFSTAQVKEIMDLFSFENSKLDIAKYAYKYTVDRSDYFILADAFSFSSNKDELMKYIQANK